MASWDRIRGAYARGVSRGLDDVADAIVTAGSDIIREEAIDEGTLLRSGETREVSEFEREAAWTADHAQPVHDGQEPHWPDMEALRDWVERNVRIDEESGGAVFKPKTADDTRSPREAEIDSITYLVAKKISEEGTDPVLYAQRGARKVRPKAARLMSENIQRELGGVR